MGEELLFLALFLLGMLVWRCDAWSHSSCPAAIRGDIADTLRMTDQEDRMSLSSRWHPSTAGSILEPLASIYLALSVNYMLLLPKPLLVGISISRPIKWDHLGMGSGYVCFKYSQITLIRLGFRTTFLSPEKLKHHEKCSSSSEEEETFFLGGLSVETFERR